ncbi:MAG: hypothetical protein IKJ88_03125 [Clostridia bacterium]|nr:hypothetical protein [Clostridia bacterium]
MKEFVKNLLEKLKLIYIWFTKILFAKDHFKVAPWTKLWLNLHGYLVDQYMIYDFKHRGSKEYLAEFDWYRSRNINGDYSFILNNKIVCADMLKQYTNVPKTYVTKVGKVMVMSDNTIATDEKILECIRENAIAIMKPINFGKGNGVNLITYENRKFFVNKQEKTDKELLDFLKSSKNWFLSEYICQGEYLNRIYYRTANTIRLITLRDPDTQEFKVFFAVQRIGTDKTFPVDNGSRGGLVSCIDLETGALSEAKTLHNLDVYDVHPNTGAQIKGAVIPNWLQIKNDVLALANKFPYLSFVAWDILVTNNGFYVIEANTSSGVNIIQLWGGQRNGELGRFYKAHNVIKK